MTAGPEGESEAAREAQRRTKEALEQVARQNAQRRQEQLRRAQQLRQSAPATEPVEKLEDARKRVEVEREESDLGLSRIVGRGTMVLMGFQVLVIDGGFLTYAAENSWHMPPEVMISWLGAGTLQIVGSVALVVARHLFPGKKTGQGSGG
jgi:hypothetical protein